MDDRYGSRRDRLGQGKQLTLADARKLSDRELVTQLFDHTPAALDNAPGLDRVRRLTTIELFEGLLNEVGAALHKRALLERMEAAGVDDVFNFVVQDVAKQQR